MNIEDRWVIMRRLEIDIARRKDVLTSLIQYKNILTKMIDSDSMEEKYINMLSFSRSTYELPNPTTLRKRYLLELGIVKSKIHSEEINLKELYRNLEYNRLCARLGV